MHASNTNQGLGLGTFLQAEGVGEAVPAVLQNPTDTLQSEVENDAIDLDLFNIDFD